LLFDLDGTLADSADGILAALRQAFADHDLAPLDATTERALLGPPFYESLPPLVGDESVARAVIASYRRHYRAGAMFDTRLYDGVRGLLAAARAGGVRMAVATSKSEAFAVPIVRRLGVAGYFATVGGDELDGSRGTKTLVVADVLRRLRVDDPGTVVMVGDRLHDVAGAHANGVACIGAAWGYASPGELAAARPAAIADHPDEVRRLLGLAAVASEDDDAAAS
jgi:phosphoglycolate phosphatase